MIFKSFRVCPENVLIVICRPCIFDRPDDIRMFSVILPVPPAVLFLIALMILSLMILRKMPRCQGC